MIHDYLDAHRQEMLEELCRLVRIPSYWDETTAREDQPFGASVRQGLEAVLALGEKLGFQCRNVGGYAAELTMGTGPKLLGILCHEDVVEPGDGWETDPFQPVVKDGRLYGRGTMDDKGPIVSAMYAVHYLAQAGLLPDTVSIRLIVGANEEEEWRCIDYYKEHTDRLPDLAIVPDGYFPLVFCEKGLMDFDMHTLLMPNANAQVQIQVTDLQGGFARNIVPGKASCILRGEEDVLAEACRQLTEDPHITCRTLEGSGALVQVTGKSTHAMDPDKGESALSILLDALGNLPQSLSIRNFLDRWNAVIGTDCHGEKLGCDETDELSGRFTFNVGKLTMTGDTIHMQANYRFPISMDFAETEHRIASRLQTAGFEYEPKAYMEPLYVDPQSDFIAVLLDAYRRISGDTQTQPLAIGGATYARAIPNAVAFGPLFPWEEELAHEANECLDLENFYRTTEIYADALRRLSQQ